MSLSEKSDEEISQLLTEYGIKHGPIVDSTRRLYERKLEKAMEEAAPNGSSDKTYYREEEVVTYITYHSPPRCEATGDVGLRHREQREQREPIEQQHRQEEDEEEEESVPNEEPVIQSSVTNAAQSSAASKPAAKASKAGCVWSVIRLLLLLALLAAVCYYLLCNVVSPEENQQLQ